MEVSSIAVDQYRVAGLQFSGGIFTNLTHDHLDYHGSYRNYLEAKKAFFDTLHKKAFALTNIDDRNGEVMIQNTVAQKYRYGLTRLSDFHGKILESRFEGMGLLIEDKEVWVRLSGKFNAYNILAVYAACILLGHDQDQVLEQISNAGTVAGRFDIVRGSGGTLAVIDYAHTDDALKNVLESIIEVNAENLDITTVVGAGGERDRDKRPKMGSVAARLSTRVILTSDNPRSEDPAAIIKEMQQGIDPSHMDQVLKITDREEAIKTACMLAPVGSIILLAGKGHEKYQEIKGERFHFDDKEVVTKYLK